METHFLCLCSNGHNVRGSRDQFTSKHYSKPFLTKNKLTHKKSKCNFSWNITVFLNSYIQRDKIFPLWMETPPCRNCNFRNMAFILRKTVMATQLVPLQPPNYSYFSFSKCLRRDVFFCGAVLVLSFFNPSEPPSLLGLRPACSPSWIGWGPS